MGALEHQLDEKFDQDKEIPAHTSEVSSMVEYSKLSCKNGSMCCADLEDRNSQESPTSCFF
jgi:hypothetical protein